MIHVTLSYSGNIVSGLEVKGHANSGPYGEDLVCAAVSSIITGGFNGLMEEDIKSISIEEGYASVEIVLNKHAIVVLETITIQLKTLEITYPQFIKIK